MEEEICLVDSCTTNAVLWEVKILHSRKKRGQVLTIVGRDAMIVGSGRATISYFQWVHKLISRMLYSTLIQLTPY
jgi:hypothetical protein